MDKNQARKRIQKLKKLIEKYRYAYHVLDKLLVPDAINDSLKHELQELEQKFPDLVTPDSPTQRVGGKPLDKFKKVVHAQPMLSLTDAFSIDEIRDWEKRNTKILRQKPREYFAEVKIDGLAVSLRYQNGNFIQGSTRGDGRVGEDVTQNLKTVEAIPLKISAVRQPPSEFEARGEVYMKLKVFKELNEKYRKAGKPRLANPRNAAAGSIRQLDPKLAAERKLSFFGYDLIIPQAKVKNFATHADKHRWLKKLGFPTAEGRECRDLAEVEKFYRRVTARRKKLPYLIDGVWVGINRNRIYDKLGRVGKAPRGAIAYKFAAEEKTTLIKDIVNQVGRSGKITPVAVMEPVQLGGSRVSRATLHNWQEIAKKDVRMGDTVIIRKAGDIIPEVVRVIKALRPAGSKPLRSPRVCPNCHRKLIRRKSDQVNLFCPNKNCGRVRQRQLEHFVSKKGLNIDGLGGKILEQLTASGLIKDEADIFKLKAEDLKSLERFADKSAENLIEAIERAKNVPLANFIFALGIRHIGEAGAAQIGRTIEARGAITPSQFFEKMKLRSQLSSAKNAPTAAGRGRWREIYDIGIETEKSMLEYFNSADNQKKLQELTRLGVKIILPKRLPQNLKDKTFAITGSLDSMTRDEAEAQIRLRGGQAASAVSRETDYLVLGDNPGSKYDKAQKLGIKIINEKQFLKLLKK